MIEGNNSDVWVKCVWFGKWLIETYAVCSLSVTPFSQSSYLIHRDRHVFTSVVYLCLFTTKVSQARVVTSEIFWVSIRLYCVFVCSCNILGKTTFPKLWALCNKYGILEIAALCLMWISQLTCDITAFDSLTKLLKSFLMFFETGTNLSLFKSVPEPPSVNFHFPSHNF